MASNKQGIALYIRDRHGAPYIGQRTAWRPGRYTTIVQLGGFGTLLAGN